MSELAEAFMALPSEHQGVLRLAQDQHNINVTPLQQLEGGRSGAFIYLVSVSSPGDTRVRHLVLKLDQPYQGEPDEVDRHNTALVRAPPNFANDHMPELAFDRVELDGSIAIFYTIAGESLHQYRPLASFERQSQLETIFRTVSTGLLKEWNAELTFEQTLQPQSLLAQWLGYRLEPGSNIERFLEEICRINPDTAGLIITGVVYPNPWVYARQIEPWDSIRPIDAIIGFKHGDLNTNNILVKFSKRDEELEGYYLIDFALFQEQAPLLYDHLYLELAYLVRLVSRVPFANWVDLVSRFANQDILYPQQMPIELAGPAASTSEVARVISCPV